MLHTQKLCHNDGWAIRHQYWKRVLVEKIFWNEKLVSLYQNRKLCGREYIFWKTIELIFLLTEYYNKERLYSDSKYKHNFAQVFCKKGSQISHKKSVVRLSFVTDRSKTLLKRDFSKGVFLWVLQKFSGRFFLGAYPCDCVWKYLVKVINRDIRVTSLHFVLVTLLLTSNMYLPTRYNLSW